MGNPKKTESFMMKVNGARLAALAATCLLATPGTQAQHRPANIGVGVSHRAVDTLLVSNLNIGLFGNVDVLRGAQASALTSVARSGAAGVNVGLLSAFARGRADGVQAGGAVSGVDGTMRGVQLSGVSCVAKRVSGVQAGGLTNAATQSLHGVQLAGITNIAMDMDRGVQLSGVANVCASGMRGVQAALYNYADTLSGVQVGLLNVCARHDRGVQVGVINLSRDTVARKVGLVNVNPKTAIDVMVGAGTSTKTNLAVRFRNRSTYNIIGLGTHYMGLDRKFSGALFYRIGQYFRVTRRLSLSGDLGFFHVETFEEHADTKPERLYSIQARIGADCRLGRVAGVYVALGYGDTRHYCHSRRYRDRAIVEAGLTLRCR